MNEQYIQGYQKAVQDIETILDHRKETLQEPFLREAQNPKADLSLREQYMERVLLIEKIVENAKTGIRLACNGMSK